MPDEVVSQVADRIATLTINRPEQRNALSPATLETLRAEFVRLGSDAEVRVIVLTGAGDRAFCSGADMGGGSSGVFNDPQSYEAYLGRAGFPDLFEAMHACPRPIIAAVRGYCLAGGLGVALACDLIVCGEGARFGTPEVQRGLFPMMIFAEIVRNLGLKQAMELVLMGELLPGSRAREFGFVNRCVPDDEIDAAVAEIAARLAGFSPAVLGLGKRACYTVADMGFSQALEFLRSQLTINLLTEDSAEGLQAFREKREPNFRGR